MPRAPRQPTPTATPDQRQPAPTADQRLVALVTNHDPEPPPGVFTFRALVNVGNPELSEAFLACDWLIHLAIEHPDRARPVIANVHKAVGDALRTTRTTRTRAARKRRGT